MKCVTQPTGGFNPHKKIFILIFSFFSFFCNIEASPYRQKSPVKIQSFLSNFTKTSLREFCAEFAHQMSESLLAKALTGSEINIHMCANPDDKMMLWDEGVTPLKIHNIFPTGGWSEYHEPENMSKYIATQLIGPICGSLTLFIFNFLKTYKKYKDQWSLKKILFSSTLHVDNLYQITQNLIPLYNNNGAKILKKIRPLIPTNNVFAAMIHFIVNKTLLKILTKIRKVFFHNADETENFDAVWMGEKYLMSLTNKIIATTKDSSKSGVIPIIGTDFCLSDIIRILYLVFAYPEAAKKVYI